MNASVLGSTCGKCPICEKDMTREFLNAPDRFHWRKEIYQLKRCFHCSYVWLGNPPGVEEMALHYDKEYHKAIATAGEGKAERRWRRHRKIIAQYSRSGALLDVGCSTGGFLSTLKGSAWKLYGIEVERSSAERAREISGAEIFVGDASNASFGPDSFDVITCFDVLEHFYHPRKFLQKVLEWLKPGGVFITQLPNIDSWEARLFRTYWFGLELPRHISHFSPESLRFITQGLGFQEVIICTLPQSYVERSLGFIACKMIERLGFTPIPQAKIKSRSIPTRVFWKAMRLLLLTPFARIGAAANAGPCMEGIFRKRG